MRKIQLDMESLAVESFAIDAAGAEKRGTVRGRADSDECVGPPSEAECVSFTGDLKCLCADSAPGQFSCGYFCESRDCP
jgi:hypothetical protein